MAPKVLLVLSPPKRDRLAVLLADQGLEIECVIGFQDATRKLNGPSPYDLLLVDADMPDGSWRNLIAFVQNSGMACEMIVCSRLGDHQLWAEVIQTGAYDLIAEPFEQQEVSRIVQSAIGSRYMRRFSSRTASSPPPL
jgi:DNA-binding NtrC family response regulator